MKPELVGCQEFVTLKVIHELTIDNALHDLRDYAQQ